jgi:hypothetical protein
MAVQIPPGLIMDESEIEQAMVEGRAVEAPKYDGPPLMVVHPKKLTTQGLDNLRKSLEAAMTAKPPKPVIFDEGLKVFQFIDGRWQALD